VGIRENASEKTRGAMGRSEKVISSKRVSKYKPFIKIGVSMKKSSHPQKRGNKRIISTGSIKKIGY